MTQPPVTLAEFRAYLNQAEGDADDEELWSTVLAATELVESRCGPIRPRQVTSTVQPSGSMLLLPVFPVLSVQSMTDPHGQPVPLAGVDVNVDAGRVGWLSGWPVAGDGHRYAITYTAGYDPIPQVLMQAVLVVAEQLWESQRGPASTGRFTGTGDEPTVFRGFAWPNRALQLIEPHRLLVIA